MAWIWHEYFSTRCTFASPEEKHKTELPTKACWIRHIKCFTWTVWTRCLLEQLVSNWTLRPVNCIGSTRDNFFEQTDQKMVGWLMESFKQKATHAMQPHHFRLIEGAEFLSDNARDTRPRIIFWAMLQQRSTQFQMCLRFWRLYICLHAYICACTWLRTHLGTQEPTRLRVYLSLWLSGK